jgi:tetratricopeptide (TPR) repeat protein
MVDWLQSLPSELAYGVITAGAVAAGAWLFARLRRGGIRGDDSPPQVQGALVAIDTVHELYLGGPVEKPVPRDLPLAPIGFVNRKHDLARLDAVLERADKSPGPVVAVLDGMHGVGKSAVGSYWANTMRQRFSGGDLFADFSKRRNAGSVAAEDILGDFLRDLGTPDVAIPVSLADKKKLFRRLTAERRLLVLLDDVDQPAQALNLLPAGAGSLVVVTTTHPLEELLREGARKITITPLDREDAFLLLADMAGKERLKAEAEATEALIGACGGLPVALCVCGARMVAQDGRSVSWLARKVAEAPRPLQELSPAGAFETEAIFQFAYDDLPQQQRLLYRRLGLLPELEFTPPVAAALAGSSREAAAIQLDALHGTHLLDMPGEDRYRAHELVGQHMAARAEIDEADDDREAAVRRLVDWCYGALRAADRAVVEDRLRLSDSVLVEAPDIPSLDAAADAFAWYERERRNVMTLLRVAAERRWDDRVWQFAEALWPLCASHKRFPEWIESHEAAIAASLRLEDPAVEARMRSQLARAFAEKGEHARAEEEMRASRVAVHRCENEMLKASVVEFGGVCLLRAGRPLPAQEAFEEARSMFASCRSTRGTALQDYHLGWTLVLAKQFGDSLSPLERALEVMEAVPDPINVGRILVRKGEALAHLDRRREAETALEEGVAVLDTAGIWYERAEAYEALSGIARQCREPDLARARLQQAYRIYREFGHPRADELLLELSQLGSHPH